MTTIMPTYNDFCNDYYNDYYSDYYDDKTCGLYRYGVYKGRIWSRQQLAGGVLVVSWGCSGGAQRSCWDHVHLIQLVFKGNPMF